MALSWGDVANNAKQAGSMAWGTNVKSLPEMVGLLINGALGLLGLIFLGLGVYSGFKWMTARGDEKEVEEAKDTLKNAIIGIVIVVASYAISSYVVGSLISTVAP